MQELITKMVTEVVVSLSHNWFPLSLAILITAILKVHIAPEKLKQALLRRSNVSIPASVAFGAFTPLCACGTMAVIIAMLTTVLPWGPIMAFLTSSPLMSPEGFVLVTGIIGLRFAIALTVASIIIGLASGYLTHLIEKKTDFLKDQVRFVKEKKVESVSTMAGGNSVPDSFPVVSPLCGCHQSTPVPKTACCVGQLCCASTNAQYIGSIYLDLGAYRVAEFIGEKFSGFVGRLRLKEIQSAVIDIGVKQILLYYSIFVAIGFLINQFVPASIIGTLFSGKNIFSVPLAALIGLPLYVNGESALPLIKTLIAGGAGEGAMLAFLITGPGTSAGVIAGIATIMKKRAIILYVLYLLVGGIVLGYLYDLLLTIGI